MNRSCACFLLLTLHVSTARCQLGDQLPGEDPVTFSLRQSLAWSAHIMEDRLFPIEYLSRVSGYMFQRKVRMVSSNGTRYAGAGGALIDGVLLPPSEEDVYRYRDKVTGHTAFRDVFFWGDVEPQPDPEFAARYPHLDNFYRFITLAHFIPYFAEMDTDGDGKGSEEEMRTYFLQNDHSRRRRTRGAPTTDQSTNNRTYRRCGISIDAAEGIVPPLHRDDVFPPELYGMYFRPPGMADGNASESVAGYFDNDLVVRLRRPGPSKGFQYHPPTAEFSGQQLENGAFGDDIYDYTYQPTYPYDLMDFGFIQKSLDGFVYEYAGQRKRKIYNSYNHISPLTSLVADKTSVGSVIHNLLLYISTHSLYIPSKPIDPRTSLFIQHYFPRHLIAPPLPVLPEDLPPALEELVLLMSPNPWIVAWTEEVIERSVENGFASLPLHRFLLPVSANTTNPVSFGLTYKYFRMWWQVLYDYDDNTTTDMGRMGYVNAAAADGGTSVSYREHYGEPYVKQYDAVEPEDVNTFNKSYYLATRGEFESVGRYEEEPTTVTQTLIPPVVLVINNTTTPTTGEPGGTNNSSQAVIVAVAVVFTLLIVICLIVLVLYYHFRSPGRSSSSSPSPPVSSSYPKPSAHTHAPNPLSPLEALASSSQLRMINRRDELVSSTSLAPSHITTSYDNEPPVGEERYPFTVSALTPAAPHRNNAADGQLLDYCGTEDKFTVRSGHTMTALEMLRDGWTIDDGTTTNRSVESAFRMHTAEMDGAERQSHHRANIVGGAASTDGGYVADQEF